jgi:hypothetical protein
VTLCICGHPREAHAHAGYCLLCAATRAVDCDAYAPELAGLQLARVVAQLTYERMRRVELVGPTRKPYSKPVLTCFGTLADITRAMA